MNEECDCEGPEHDARCRLSPDYDPTPWCPYGHRGPEDCDCGPLARND
jgi:hypothetical protein